MSRGGVTNRSVIIAHSISTNWLIKYIYEFKLEIIALISVAGALELSPTELSDKEDYHYSTKKESLPRSVEINYAKKHINQIFLYYSDNDHHATSEMFANFIYKLKATPIFCKGQGHFTARHNVKYLPNIEQILKSLKQ